MRNILRRSTLTSGSRTSWVSQFPYILHTRKDIFSVPLAFDRASESKVGVFYTKFDDDSNRNRRNNFNSVVIRILDKSKRNDSMYSIRLGDGGQVTMAVSQLQASVVMNFS